MRTLIAPVYWPSKVNQQMLNPSRINKCCGKMPYWNTTFTGGEPSFKLVNSKIYKIWDYTRKSPIQKRRWSIHPLNWSLVQLVQLCEDVQQLCDIQFNDDPKCSNDDNIELISDCTECHTFDAIIMNKWADNKSRASSILKIKLVDAEATANALSQRNKYKFTS